MVHEGVLLESPTMRASIADRTEALDKVKALSLLSDGTHVTTSMVAHYFEVGLKTIKSLIHDHRAELEGNGYRVLTGTELGSFKELSSVDKHAGRHLALFTRRTVLNVAMLLRDSVVAAQVRHYLLDAEARHRFPQGSRPVENSVVHNLVEWLDERIERSVAEQLAQYDTRMARVAEDSVRAVLAQTVVPLLNHAVRADGEQRREMSEIRRELARIDRALRARMPANGMTAVDAMTPREFEDHVAGLCRRDGCVGVTGCDARDPGDGDGHGPRLGGAGSTDLLGRAADGRTLVVRCGHIAPYRKVESEDVRRFVGMAKDEYEADVALFVTAATFTSAALDLAVRHGVTAVHRRLLEAWSGGATLHVLR
ncbi:restriction endonuclease [Streptomyces sp. Z26]|uniref:restriction endonuclease n=1 Tax=Streptomyces sp. Z26 TaxID=2500177 RepID=UPI000EF15BF1|nr:restriction endonuclease [Streptomyces sp. Z26]RLL67865.1 restriction endonuclease [Streptomyces sp. Z26]